MSKLFKKILKALKISVKGFLVLFLIYISYLNIRLYYQPTFSDEGYNESVYFQLKYLEAELERGAAKDMQKIYPEGYLFTHLLYGLSWANWAVKLPENSAKRAEANLAMLHNWQALTNQQAKRIFPKDLPLKYGAFYTSWTSYYLARMLDIQPKKDSLLIQAFKQNCQKIDQVLQAASHPFIESYHGQSWPADIAPGIAALVWHDRMFEARYQKSIQKWVADLKPLLDPELGMIPHSVYSEDGRVKEGPQGSSASLLLVFMAEIDPKFGEQQFELYKRHFLRYRFGLPGIRAYPEGIHDKFNIDSGPVILGIGGAASLVGQQSMACYGDHLHYHAIRNSIEAFGMGSSWKKQKSYLFGLHPMADAFICWNNSVEQQDPPIQAKSNWRWIFQILSLLILIIILFILIKR